MVTDRPDVALRERLAGSANAGGGWGYYQSKSSRLEPTCWTLLALHDGSSSPHAAFLTRCQQSSGWLSENAELPVNVAFNGLAAFLWLVQPTLATDDQRRRLIAALTAEKGVQAPNVDTTRQNNSLQGWSWIEQTFSWMEPTAWGLLALKKSRRAGMTNESASARIDEGERLLFDRVCAQGGWNFGNANVMRQDLRPYVPTTALGLLALQDRSHEPAVERSLGFLETHGEEEMSAIALGLATICLSVYGRPTQKLQTNLLAQLERTQSLGNVHAMAIALCALTLGDRDNVFKL